MLSSCSICGCKAPFDLTVLPSSFFSLRVTLFIQKLSLLSFTSIMGPFYNRVTLKICRIV